jgi:hypothetical protein
MPSGEVALIAGALGSAPGAICAKAAPALRRTAKVVAKNNGLMVWLSCRRSRSIGVSQIEVDGVPALGFCIASLDDGL